MRRSLQVLAFTFLAGAAPLPAQTNLRWTLHPGDDFAVEHTIRQAAALEVKQKPFQQKSEMALSTRWRVREADADSARVDVTVHTMVSKVFSGDGKSSVPSKDDEAWQGAVFRLTIDTRGQVLRVQGHEELLKKLAGGSESRLKVLAALKPADSFQSLFQDVLGPLPAKPVNPGDRWTHRWTDTMSIFGSFTNTADFRYQGPQDKLQRIEGTMRSAYKTPRYAIENDVFRVTKGEVAADEGKLTLLFDAQRGRVSRVEKSSRVRGELTMDTLNGPQRVTFSSATEIEIQVRDSAK